MVNYKIIVFTSLVILTLCIGSAFAQTVDVEVAASADTFLRENGQNTNEGSATSVKIQNSNISHVLVRFDTDDIVAALDGRPLVSAYLELYLETNWNTWGTNGAILNLHRLSADWTETGATWNCADDTNPANTSPDCVTFWEGGIYASTPSASILQTNTSIGQQTFDVTVDVQTIISGGYNYGWLLRKENYAKAGSADYGSRQGLTEYRPKLIIEVDVSDDPEMAALGASGSRVWMTPNTGSEDFLDLFGSGGCSSMPDSWKGARTQNLDVFMFHRQFGEPTIHPESGDNYLWNFRDRKAFCKIKQAGKKIAIAGGAISDVECSAPVTGNIDQAVQSIRNVQCNSNDTSGSNSCSALYGYSNCQCGPVPSYPNCSGQPRNCLNVGVDNNAAVSFYDVDSALLRSYYANVNCNIPMASAATLMKEFVDKVKAGIQYINGDPQQPVDGPDINIEIGITEPWKIFTSQNTRDDTYNANNIQIIKDWVNALDNAGAKPAFFHLDVDPQRPDLQELNNDLPDLQSFFAAKNIPFGVIYSGGENVNDTQWYNNVMTKVLPTVKSSIGIPQHNLFMSWTDPDFTVPNNLTECASNSLTRALNDGWSHLKDKPKNSVYNSWSNVPLGMSINSTQNNISVTFTNTGKTTWQAPSSTDGSYYKLIYAPHIDESSCNVHPFAWGQQDGILIPPGTCIPPGGQHIFTFSITSPTTSGQYQFRWRLAKEDSNGNITKFGAFSNFGAVHCIIVGDTVPQPPPPLGPPDGAQTTSTPLLTWSAPQPPPTPPITNYELQIKHNSTGALVYNPLLGNVTSHTVASGYLQAGVTYKWRVRAKNSNGFGPWGTFRIFTVQATQNYVMIDMGSPDSAQGISRPNSEPTDGLTIAAAKTTGPSPCNPANTSISMRKNRGNSDNDPNSPDDIYFYFKVDDNFINGNAPPINIVVEYFSQTLPGEPPNFCLQYKKQDGSWATDICESVGNTGCMKTRTFTNPPNVYFGNTLAAGADFRIWTGGSGSTTNTRRYINIVKVVKQ